MRVDVYDNENIRLKFRRIDRDFFLNKIGNLEIILKVKNLYGFDYLKN